MALAVSLVQCTLSVAECWDKRLVPDQVGIQHLQSAPFHQGETRRVVDYRNPNLCVREVLFGSSECPLHLFNCRLFGSLSPAVDAEGQHQLLHQHLACGFGHQCLCMTKVCPRVTINLQVRDRISREPSKIGVTHDQPLFPHTQAPVNHFAFCSDVSGHSAELWFWGGGLEGLVTLDWEKLLPLHVTAVRPVLLVRIAPLRY